VQIIKVESGLKKCTLQYVYRRVNGFATVQRKGGGVQIAKKFKAYKEFCNVQYFRRFLLA
jgi:hypothetical protein